MIEFLILLGVFVFILGYFALLASFVAVPVILAILVHPIWILLLIVTLPAFLIGTLDPGEI